MENEKRRANTKISSQFSEGNVVFVSSFLSLLYILISKLLHRASSIEATAIELPLSLRD